MHVSGHSDAISKFLSFSKLKTKRLTYKDQNSFAFRKGNNRLWKIISVPKSSDSFEQSEQYYLRHNDTVDTLFDPDTFFAICIMRTPFLEFTCEKFSQSWDQ